MIKETARGTRDFLPEEVELRENMKETILKTYQKLGFKQIETPLIENIENLEGSEGGENLSLIFKILKRGEKLDLESKNLADLGLRYDLTLPLARYYANNQNNLEVPFKVVQVGNVFRAEKPQKGRFRQFIQCDIDIIGEDEVTAEIELIYATSRALKQLGFADFTIEINDRRYLKEKYLNAGFTEDKFMSFCIILDKIDKIGQEKVTEELVKAGYEAEKIDNLFKSFESECENEDLQFVMKSFEDAKDVKIKYNPFLIRGMGYYTGIIFEIKDNELGLAIAGGGRYDGMIGQFQKDKVSAVGFSIGFERVYEILKKLDHKKAEVKEKVALVYDKENVGKALAYLEEHGDKENQTIGIYRVKNKNKIGKLLKKIEQNGYGEIVKILND
ncbi:histidyl-tRNA synthetase [Desulfonispora thiosulfatigenes DSM 11270]|uniref:Histidine--tRNA ligase n=1 Tax=Desulfonispora thiosulfatigenes DSM 11270 TaxID=656914 RepID=A0A1W1VB51_DESTI|nr:histidine--tRNA ligase [Desulfonispora thiosulfatigenes]SMB90281.1 histidyl-tRNA synthetase [Desulfonispora thiosulfatigenes DSM 11270]